MTVSVFAPAKVNLTLHVTGLRDDGYHLLDSLVAFAPVGDTVEAGPGAGLSLAIEGPEAGALAGDGDNLVLRGAALVAAGRSASLRLTKRLPVASGIGGGSSDAAAAVRAGCALWQAEAPGTAALAALGADVPMCLTPRPWRVRGIGERLDPVDLPPLPAVLANPRLPVATPAVFRALARRDNPPMPGTLPAFADAAALIGWLAGCRNDLEAAALKVEPAIAGVLAALAALDGARLVRMSGSGATCFALFESEVRAEAAARALAAWHPDWWVASGVLGDQTDAAGPRRVVARV